VKSISKNTCNELWFGLLYVVVVTRQFFGLILYARVERDGPKGGNIGRSHSRVTGGIQRVGATG
jgi:hypothetical protein